MKNWKDNRGILLNNQNIKKQNLENSINIDNIFNYPLDDYIKKNINLKRIVDLEFNNINYIDKIGIKKYYKWVKM